MAGPGFVSYIIENDKKFQAIVKRTAEIVSDLRPAFELIYEDFLKSEKVIFRLKGPGRYPDFQGPKVGTTWKNPGRPEMRTRDPNKTAYQNEKIKRFGFDYPLLKASGDLEASVTQRGAKGSFLRSLPKSLEIGTEIPYGKYHQQDDGEGDRIPMRKFLYIGPESEKWASNKQLTGRAERWFNIINTFVLRETGSSFSEATGESRNR